MLNYGLYIYIYIYIYIVLEANAYNAYMRHSTLLEYKNKDVFISIFLFLFTQCVIHS